MGLTPNPVYYLVAVGMIGNAQYYWPVMRMHDFRYDNRLECNAQKQWPIRENIAPGARYICMTEDRWNALNPGAAPPKPLPKPEKK